MNQWTPGYCCNFLPKIIKEKHIFEQDEGALSQIIYLTPPKIHRISFKTCCTSFPVSLAKHTLSDVRKEINQEQMKFS